MKNERQIMKKNLYELIVKRSGEMQKKKIGLRKCKWKKGGKYEKWEENNEKIIQKMKRKENSKEKE